MAGKEGGEGDGDGVFRPGFLVDYLYGQADAETREVRGLVLVVRGVLVAWLIL